MFHEMYLLLHYYLSQGGTINVLIFISCCIILFIATGKLRDFRRFTRSIPSTESLKTAIFSQAEASLPLWLTSVKNHHSHLNNTRYNTAVFINRYREILIHESSVLDSGIAMMGTFVSITPLLGLLGTVVGMIDLFSVLTEYGVGNPSLLSEGISVALITTQTGLLVAFPCMMLHSHIVSTKNDIINQLIRLGEHCIEGE